MYEISAEVSFDSAHFLAGYDGKCRNIHGHRWRIRAAVCADELVADGQTRGMVADFGDLKAALKEIADELDHSLIYEKGTLRAETLAALKAENFRLNEIPCRPTAENFAKLIFDRLKTHFDGVKRVIVYETPGNRAEYYE